MNGSSTGEADGGERAAPPRVRRGHPTVPQAGRRARELGTEWGRGGHGPPPVVAGRAWTLVASEARPVVVSTAKLSFFLSIVVNFVLTCRLKLSLYGLGQALNK